MYFWRLFFYRLSKDYFLTSQYCCLRSQVSRVISAATLQWVFKVYQYMQSLLDWSARQPIAHWGMQSRWNSIEYNRVRFIWLFLSLGYVKQQPSLTLGFRAFYRPITHFSHEFRASAHLWKSLPNHHEQGQWFLWRVSKTEIWLCFVSFYLSNPEHKRILSITNVSISLEFMHLQDLGTGCAHVTDVQIKVLGKQASAQW